MAGLLPPVVATLLADTREYMAKMSEAEGKMTQFGTVAETTGGKLTAFGKKASTAIIGVGAAMIGYGIDSALKYTESLDKIQNQSNASAAEIEYLKTKIMDVSNETTIASDKIASAFLVVEKAGITGANGYALVDAAAKAAVITGGDVTEITKSIVAAQSLQVAKGMDVAAISDLMVNANKAHIGSLDSLVSILKGKVGGALAGVGVNMAEAAAIADVASKAGYESGRAFTTIASGMQKIENPTKASVKALKAFGLDANALAKTAKTPGTGVIDVLKQLETQSRKTGIPLNALIAETFGKGSVGIISALAKQIPELTTLNDKLNKSSGADLATTFGMTSSQLNFKLTSLKNQAKNLLTGIGLFFLPTVTDLANWASNAIKFFQDHPLIKTIASDSAIALFAGSIAFKLGSAVSNIVRTITGTTSAAVTAETQVSQTALLTEIAANTLASATALGASDMLSSGANIAQIAGTSNEVIAGEAAAARFLPMLGAIATALGVGALLGNYIGSHFSPGKDVVQNAKDEFAHNKLKGSYDVAATTVDAIFGFFNAGLKHLPGKPALPMLPQFQYSGTSGGVGSNYGVLAPKSTGTNIIQIMPPNRAMIGTSKFTVTVKR
jgi:TP901 family phage tail tape measure protein